MCTLCWNERVCNEVLSLLDAFYALLRTPRIATKSIPSFCYPRHLLRDYKRGTNAVHGGAPRPPAVQTALLNRAL